MSVPAVILFRTALASTAVLLVCSFLIDSNGNLPHMGRTASLMLTLLLFGLGIASSLSLLVVEKSRRLLALLLLAVLVALAFPAFF